MKSVVSDQKKVLYPLPQGAQRRLKRKNTLPLRLLFALKLLMMWGLLTGNFLAVPFELVDPVVQKADTLSTA